jgi:transcriptional regulator NrdR family protein
MISDLQVVKRLGNDQLFNQAKLRGSIIASLQVAGNSDSEMINRIADLVMKEFMVWCSDKSHVTTQDIRGHIADLIGAHNTNAAYAYQHHRTIR